MCPHLPRGSGGAQGEGGGVGPAAAAGGAARQAAEAKELLRSKFSCPAGPAGRGVETGGNIFKKENLLYCFDINLNFQ